MNNEQKPAPARILFLEGPLKTGNGYAIANSIKILDAINNDDIILYINTPGGDVMQCLGIIDAINEARSDVYTVATGQASSAGGFILISGTKGKRCMTKNSRLMLHMPRGQSLSDQESIRYVTEVKHILDTVVADASGQDVDEVKRKMTLEIFLSAEEALAEGLIDKVI